MSYTTSVSETQPIYVRVNVAAGLIGVSAAKVWAAMRSGELRRVKCGGRTLIKVSELEDWVEGRTAALQV